MPGGYQYVDAATDDRILSRTVFMACPSIACDTHHPVKEAAGWLVSVGFAAASEQNVAACFRDGCVLRTRRATDAGTVDITATLGGPPSSSLFQIRVRAEFTD